MIMTYAQFLKNENDKLQNINESNNGSNAICKYIDGAIKGRDNKKLTDESKIFIVFTTKQTGAIFDNEHDIAFVDKLEINGRTLYLSIQFSNRNFADEETKTIGDVKKAIKDKFNLGTNTTISEGQIEEQSEANDVEISKYIDDIRIDITNVKEHIGRINIKSAFSTFYRWGSFRNTNTLIVVDAICDTTNDRYVEPASLPQDAGTNEQPSDPEQQSTQQSPNDTSSSEDANDGNDETTHDELDNAPQPEPQHTSNKEEDQPNPIISPRTTDDEKDEETMPQNPENGKPANGKSIKTTDLLNFTSDDTNDQKNIKSKSTRSTPRQHLNAEFGRIYDDITKLLNLDDTKIFNEFITTKDGTPALDKKRINTYFNLSYINENNSNSEASNNNDLYLVASIEPNNNVVSEIGKRSLSKINKPNQNTLARSTTTATPADTHNGDDEERFEAARRQAALELNNALNGLL